MAAIDATAIDATAADDLAGGGHLLELARVAARSWPRSAGGEVRLIGVSENATFSVDGPAGRSVLRVHRLGYHQAGAIESELDWIEGLAREGAVQVPAVHRSTDGRRVVEVFDPVAGETRSCVLFDRVVGTEPDAADPNVFEQLGGITARLHRHAASWCPPPGFVRATWDPTTMIAPGGRWGDWADGPRVGLGERTLLSRLARVLGARLAAFGRSPERFGLVHADLRPANLLVGRDGDLTVIDFDDCGFSWWLYDLGTAVSFFEDSPAVPELIHRWLTGYRRIRPIPAADEAEIGTFVLLRRLLLLAWLGSHPAVPETVALSATFAAGTCELAERYLSSHPFPASAP